MLAGIVSIDDQIQAMAARWPMLKVIERGEGDATWVGTLIPSSIKYEVRIKYRAPLAIERSTILQIQPRVQVLSPLLEWHPEFEDGPVPHVYKCELEPNLPFLCLFDPYQPEWSASDLLAETTVPWTASYLFFYEGWLALGQWLGPGRHPDPEELNPADGTRAALAKV
jgi:hypothetical protein